MNKFVFFIWVVMWNFTPAQSMCQDNIAGNHDLNFNKRGSKESVTDINSAKKDHKIILYIGTYTNNKSKGIYLVKFDTLSGKLLKPECAAEISNPSFQWITADKKQLWSVVESPHGKGQIVGFAINRQNGALHKLKTYSSEGVAPCFVTFDNSMHSVLAANYGTGNVVRLSVDKTGCLRGRISAHQHLGSGPNLVRQSTPHAHSIKIDLMGRYAYSCDLGADKIYVYDLSQPGLHVDTIIHDAPGSGPRHIAFHPGRKAMSVVHELNNTVSTYVPDKMGRFTLLRSVVSTLPSAFSGKSYCADIHYSPDGHMLYASNRGHNSITIFKVNPKTMKPEVVGWMSEAIHWPRNFTIDPSGNFLLVANQKSDDITVYKIDRKTGLLKYTGNRAAVSMPVCLTWLK